MPQITIEYMIMIPILILQIFLFPFTANWIMNMWVDSRRTLALQEISSDLGSIIQQIYFSLNHETVSAGTVTHRLNVPPFIEDHPYNGNATLRAVSEPPSNSSRILDITLRLSTVGTTVATSVVLGENAEWKESTFVSNSTNACIIAEKFTNGTICLSFGG